MTRNVLTTLFAIVVLIILGQSKTLRPYVLGIGVIVFVGYLLVHYPTIRQQFANVGK